MAFNPMCRSFAREVVCPHPGGSHKLAYREWSPAPVPHDVHGEPRTVLCLHGLTRNGRDFDPLAARLAAQGNRVICPDLPGRGLSEWLPDGSMYELIQYVSDCATLLAHREIESVDWVGTSLGGLVGLVLASREDNPIERLVVNDIGPYIEPSGLDRIRGYVGDCRVHADFDAAERALRHTMRAFGPHDDTQFRVLSTHYFVNAPGGGLIAHYDPALADSLVASGNGEPPDLWSQWEQIRVPVLVLRGADSDILSQRTVERMCSSRGSHGRRVDHVEFAGVGHAPTLIADDQIDAVMSWLASTTEAVTADAQH